MLNKTVYDNPPVPEENIEHFKQSTKTMITELQEKHAHQQKILKAGKEQILHTEPNIKNFTAALDCTCQCHPKPYDPTIHDDVCRCQLTETERKTKQKETMEALLAFSTQEHEIEKKIDKQVEQTAKKLNITITSYGGGAPFVIQGTVNGRTFYLRERHNHYRLVVSGTQNPLADVYHTSPPDALIIARGDAEDLPAYQQVEEMLTLITNTIQLHLQQQTCTHTNTPFCANCGTPKQNTL